MVSLKCKEIATYVYSSLLFISGLILVVISCLMWYQIFYHYSFLPSDTTLPFVLMVFAGLIQLFLTWLAVKGPSKEHDFFIIASVILIIVILVIELSIGIYSIVLMNRLGDKTTSLMNSSFSNHVKNFDYHKKEWNSLQSKLECCGVDGPQDYGDRSPRPPSCCVNDIITNRCTSTHKLGCRIPLVSHISPLLRNIAIAGFITSLLHVCGVALFTSFYNGLKQDRLLRSANRVRLRQSLRGYPNNSQTSNIQPPNVRPTAPVV